MKITRVVEVPIGHRLQHHEGKCKHVHGHNYKITVMIAGKIHDATGMLMDYSELKELMAEVIDPFDHAMVLQAGDPFIPHAREGTDRLILFSEPPTAEAFAVFFRSQIMLLLVQRNWFAPRCAVKVEETGNTAAYCSDDENIMVVADMKFYDDMTGGGR